LKQAGILFVAMPIMSIYPILAQRHRLEGISAAVPGVNYLVRWASIILAGGSEAWLV
jgi:hypothetical protein